MGNSSYLDYQLISDARYGQIKKFTYDGSLILQKSVDYSRNAEQMGQYIGRCELARQLDHKNLLKLHRIDVDNTIVTVYSEWSDNDLFTEINSRQINQNMFYESEVQSYLEQLINVGAYLQANQLYHGDYRPQNIHITTSGQLKIAQFQLLGIVSPSKYHSPEQLDTQCTTINPYKSDVFSLGMLILNIMTLTSMNCCYTKSSPVQINYNLINELLNISNYTTELTNKVRQLLLQPNQRPDFITLASNKSKLISRLLQSSPPIHSSYRYSYKQSHSAQKQPQQQLIQQSQQPQQLIQIQQQPPPILIQAPSISPIRTTIRTSSPFTFRTVPSMIMGHPKITLTPQKYVKSNTKLQSPPTSNRSNKRHQTEYSPSMSNLDKRIRIALETTNETLRKNNKVL